MNLLALVGTVWLFTTPAFHARDTIGFLGSDFCGPPAGATQCLLGQDDTLDGAFPAIGLTYAQTNGGKDITLIAVQTETYCEAFVIRRQKTEHMRGVAVFFDRTCSFVLVPRQYRWTAKRLTR